MSTIRAKPVLMSSSSSSSGLESPNTGFTKKLGFIHIGELSNNKVVGLDRKKLRVSNVRSNFLQPIKAIEDSKTTYLNGDNSVRRSTESELQQSSDCDCPGISGNKTIKVSSVGKSTNIAWHDCSVGKLDRQQLLQQKGCVIWITGLSGSGKSTVACALSRRLNHKGKLSYILDGDNVRHGLNRDLSFKAEDRAENIRRIGEVAKLFADAGVICIASLISPYRTDRDACRALVPDGEFIEVFMDVPLHICEARDSKGLYKLARAGKIKGFTGVDDPYEPPLNSEIVIEVKDGPCSSPFDMADQVVSFLEEKGFLQA
ncbi:hypothetical protein MKW94_028442 [Papaver nudicaule]|uniref:Adenylyl-sulfate kinase n=1 Tax=Papaver nudicaule TaxID=74823 RepID=A0AA41SE50_PAPNU|nr:hypothetical protein [Papaver nudicaule]